MRLPRIRPSCSVRGFSLTSNSSVSAQCKEIIEICNQLSPHNQRKVLAYSKNLLSAQQMEEDLLAAHARTDVEQTPEGVQHDLDIMNDDSKWEE